MTGVADITSELQAQLDALRSVVSELDPDEVTVREASGLYAKFCDIERLAAGAKTLLARRVADGDGWKRQGHRTAGEYLAKLAGTSLSAGRSTLETSKRLSSAPGTEAALRRGELSTQQADLVAGAASHDPGAEDGLLDLAGRASLAELREECGRIKAAADPDPEATYRRIDRERYLRQRLDSEGAWCLHGRAPADIGAEIQTVLAPLIDEMFANARAEGRHEPRDAYALDALREALRICWQARHGTYDPEPAADGNDAAEEVLSELASLFDGEIVDEGSRGERVGDEAPDGASSTNKSTGSAGRRSGKKRKRQRTNPRHLALIKVDLDALIRGRAVGDELCEIAGVGPVPASLLRDKLGDSIAKLLVTKGQDVVNITHLGRGPTLVQRIAVLWRSHACSVEGCARTRIEYDHRIDWATTHHTRVDQLDGLCHFHHGLKTRLGWALVPGSGKRAMVPPDDPRHRNNTTTSSSATSERNPPADAATAPDRHAPTDSESASDPTTRADSTPTNPEFVTTAA